VPGGHGSGVAVSSVGETVYVADSSAGVVDVYTRAAPGKPTVAGELVSEVTSESAGFSAEIDPQSEAGEAQTEYVFQYGPCASPSACASSPYPKSLPASAASLASDFAGHGVSVHPQGLLPGATYHFRVVAHNAHGAAEGVEEKNFTTQTAGGELVLPDGRQWEMVSPPDKLGAPLQPILGDGGVVAASVRGDAMTYLAQTPTESQPQGDADLVQVFSTRTSGGWRTQDLATPHEVSPGIALGTGGEYSFFSEDLSLAVAHPLGPLDHRISDEASEQTPFLRTNYLNGNPAEQCTPPLMHCYRPLVTAATGHENVPAGTVFGGEALCIRYEAFFCGPEFVGASPDAKHVILESKVPLTKDAGQVAGGQNLYEWSEGTLSFIGDGTVGFNNKSRGTSARHAVSNDGSRVIIGGQAQGLEGLLLRDTATGKTVQLDAAEPACLAEPKPKCESGGGESNLASEFQLASSDGSRVFFTDKRRLTKDSGARFELTHKGTIQLSDLYEYDLNAPEGHRLKDLTPLGAGEEAAAVRGVLGASEDGSWIYFVANGKLTPDAVHGTCGVNDRLEHMCNLYALHFNNGAWEAPRLIAVLSSEDESAWTSNLVGHTAQVSPGGGWLEFMSQRPLTGYDNRDASSGKPDEEVYLYRAGADTLVCASCNPTGARPSGRELTRQLVDAVGIWSNRWVAANVPGWAPYKLATALNQPRYLSDTGRLFFNSNDALVPQDVNGTEDVYQYEPLGFENAEGKHRCTLESATFSARSGGCVGLISSGTSSEESALLDASETGGDVFFLTASKLAPQDYDTSLDVYDAHECTTSSPCVAPAAAVPPPCITEASCKASPTPQPGIFGAPSSATFSGAGNVIPTPTSKGVPKKKTVKCKRGFTKKHNKCVKKAKAKRRTNRKGRK
jgi:hypothetical protein